MSSSTLDTKLKILIYSSYVEKNLQQTDEIHTSGFRNSGKDTFGMKNVSLKKILPALATTVPFTSFYRDRTRTKRKIYTESNLTAECTSEIRWSAYYECYRYKCVKGA